MGEEVTQTTSHTESEEAPAEHSAQSVETTTLAYGQGEMAERMRQVEEKSNAAAAAAEARHAETQALIEQRAQALDGKYVTKEEYGAGNAAIMAKLEEMTNVEQAPPPPPPEESEEHTPKSREKRANKKKSFAERFYGD